MFGLEGPDGNPYGVGAQMRLTYPDSRGPVRGVQAGSGYWSQNSAVQVLGMKQRPTSLWVRWPDGEETESTPQSGIKAVKVRPSGKTESTLKK